jgi:glucokinase
MGKKYAIGSDIGGSHISTVLVDVETGHMLAESQAEVKVNNQAPALEILENWAKAIRKTMQFAGNSQLTGIGFAMPGPFDYRNGIALLKNVAKYDSLYGLNVGEEIKKLLDLPTQMPFRYLNDALSFAIGECWIGKASAYKNVVAITLGTGFGSAFLTDGIPVIEGNRVPKMGYVYHIPYKSSIADEYFSTRWFVGEYETRTGEKCRGVKEIADRAANEKEAKKLFQDFGHDLGIFLSPVLKTFEAECLVIGGNISGAYPLFGPSFRDVLADQGLPVNVLISELMESAAMIGSSRLLDEKFWINVEPMVAKL